MDLQREQARVVQILESIGALRRFGHFVYSSGSHGSDYIEKDILFTSPKKTIEIADLLATRYAHMNIACVVGATMGGALFAQYVGYALSMRQNNEVEIIYAEKTHQKSSLKFRKSFSEMLAGKRVLVVEDILNKGVTAKTLVEITRASGGYVVGVGALWNRGGITASDLGYVNHLDSLVNLSFPSWEAISCPLCKSNLPLNLECGHGEDFVEQEPVA